MPRAARIVRPGLPHHIPQRGNRRAPIFFEPGDQNVYLRIMAERTRRFGVEVWAYCLMPNHVHMIMVPSDETGLSRAIGDAHRRYAAFINERHSWTGHLFQARFGSVAMTESHLISAARYVSMNPVRARLTTEAGAWPWSSVAAHLRGSDDVLVKVRPLLDRVGRFADLLEDSAECDARHEGVFRALRLAEPGGELAVRTGDSSSCPKGHDELSPANYLR